MISAGFAESRPSSLQGLKGQCLGLRRFGFGAEAGLGEEFVDEGGPVLNALESVLTITANCRGDRLTQADGSMALL